MFCLAHWVLTRPLRVLGRMASQAVRSSTNSELSVSGFFGKYPRVLSRDGKRRIQFKRIQPMNNWWTASSSPNPCPVRVRVERQYFVRLTRMEQRAGNHSAMPWRRLQGFVMIWHNEFANFRAQGNQFLQRRKERNVVFVVTLIIISGTSVGE